ncbi:hypothetical protein B7494_g6803 [Chlorociboria aeruginascens]|nr:hypothetical protein B7494_g6803 [Chlorociboria aeruginascens]
MSQLKESGDISMAHIEECLKYDKELSRVYKISNDDQPPQPWEFTSDLFPHDRGFTEEKLRQGLRDAKKKKRKYLHVALPSVYFERIFHVVQFSVGPGPLVIKYVSCYPESYNPYDYQLKAEAIQWSQALPVKTPDYGTSSFRGIRLIGASRPVSKVFVLQTRGDDVPTTVDEWDDRVIYVTIDPVEGRFKARDQRARMADGQQSPCRILVMASGNGSNFQALIDAVAAGRIPNSKIVRLIVNRAKAYATTRADQAGIPWEYFNLISNGFLAKGEKDEGKVKDARERYDMALAERVLGEREGEGEGERLDLVVLAGWMHVFGKTFLEPLEREGVRVINLHPALPGKHDGAGAIERAFNDFKAGKLDRTGVMVHYVVLKVDQGDPIMVREIEYQEREELAQLEERIHEHEHELIVEATAKVVDISRRRRKRHHRGYIKCDSLQAYAKSRCQKTCREIKIDEYISYLRQQESQETTEEVKVKGRETLDFKIKVAKVGSLFKRCWALLYKMRSSTISPKMHNFKNYAIIDLEFSVYQHGSHGLAEIWQVSVIDFLEHKSKGRLPIWTIQELGDKLKNHVNKSTIFIKWSSGGVDFNLLSKALHYFRYPDILGPKKKSLAAMPTFKVAIPGLATWKLEVVFPAWSPGSNLIGDNHHAPTDTQQLAKLLPLRFELASRIRSPRPFMFYLAAPREED